MFFPWLKVLLSTNQAPLQKLRLVTISFLLLKRYFFVLFRISLANCYTFRLLNSTVLTSLFPKTRCRNPRTLSYTKLSASDAHKADSLHWSHLPLYQHTPHWPLEAARMQLGWHFVSLCQSQHREPTKGVNHALYLHHWLWCWTSGCKVVADPEHIYATLTIPIKPNHRRSI